MFLSRSVPPQAAAAARWISQNIKSGGSAMTVTGRGAQQGTTEECMNE
jgi:hypothetical protein